MFEHEGRRPPDGEEPADRLSRPSQASRRINESLDVDGRPTAAGRPLLGSAPAGAGYSSTVQERVTASLLTSLPSGFSYTALTLMLASVPALKSPGSLTTG